MSRTGENKMTLKLFIDGKEISEATISISTDASIPVPPPRCLTGQHWDEALNKCVDDVPVPTGKYAAEVAKAIKLNQPCAWPEGFGFYKGPNAITSLNITPYSDNWFLIEPFTDNINIQFTDFAQHDNLSATFIAIDKDANPWPHTIPMSVSLSGNTGTVPTRFLHFTRDTRYLINIKEKQGIGVNYALYWWAVN